MGYLPEASQSKRPPSITAPPIAMPWPPIHLVIECMTRSAPRSSGRHRYGVANVLSTSSGMPASCAIPASAGMSSTSRPGLPIVSPITSRVLGRSAARKPSRSRGLTKVVVMPKRGSVCASRLIVPPYRDAEATMWSPAPSSVAMATCIAAMPLAVQTAPTPPSSAARRSSSTATVGLEMRL